MSTPYVAQRSMPKVCMGWLVARVDPVTSAIYSSMTWFGELSRRHRLRQASNLSDCRGLTVNDPMERLWSRELVANGLLQMWQSPTQYVRGITPSADINDSLRSSRKRSHQQINEVCHSSRHAFLRACCHRNKRCLVLTVGRIHWRPRMTDHSDYQWATRDNIFLPKNVGNTTERQCNRLPQHFFQALIFFTPGRPS